MKKKELIIAILGVLLIALTISTQMLKQPKETDALKFKQEYESLNDTIRESDGAKYNSVEISESNPIQYINAKDAVDIIKNKSGIIYFGANWCPWCRNAIEVLLEIAKEQNVKTIYYVDMDQVRNIWEIKEQKLVKTQNEGEGYYELLDSLNSILKNNYVLTDQDGKKYDTQEKRIGMPLIISVKDGKITKNHTGTVKLKENQTKYSKLDSEQWKELKQIYKEMIESIN